MTILPGMNNVLSDPRVSVNVKRQLEKIEEKESLEETLLDWDKSKLGAYRKKYPSGKKALGNRADDLEALAYMYDQEQTVSLIEFNRSPYVALYNACGEEGLEEEEIGHDTLLLLLDIKALGMKKLSPATRLDELSETGFVVPYGINESRARVRFQKRVFVWNAQGQLHGWRVYLPKEGKEKGASLPATYLVIPGGSKKKIRTYLEDTYGIHKTSMRTGRIRPPDYIGKKIASLEKWGMELDHPKEEKGWEELKRCHEAVRLNPENSDVYLIRGVEYALLEKYTEALRDFEKALTLKPDSYGAHSNRGNAWAAQGRYDEAIGAFNKAIHINAEDPVAYINRGHAKSKLKRYKEALKDYEEAIRLNPEDTEIYCMRALTKSKLGREEEALKDLEDVLRLMPDYPKARLFLGHIKYELNRFGEALKEYSRGVDLEPENPVFHFHRGVTHTDLEKYEEAVRDYDMALVCAPEDVDVYFNRGNLKEFLGQHEEAIKDLDEAIRLNPRYQEAYQARGDIKSFLGRHDEALDDHNEADRLESDI